MIHFYSYSETRVNYTLLLVILFYTFSMCITYTYKYTASFLLDLASCVQIFPNKTSCSTNCSKWFWRTVTWSIALLHVAKFFTISSFNLIKDNVKIIIFNYLLKLSLFSLNRLRHLHNIV